MLREQDGDSRVDKKETKGKDVTGGNKKEDEEREKHILHSTPFKSQKKIILHLSKGSSSVAKQAHSSVTIFPL